MVLSVSSVVCKRRIATYLATDEGWVYLAVVLDLYSRRVIGWAMDKRTAAELVCNALQMAIRQRKRPPNVIVHSDRSSQYCSQAYRDLLEKRRLIGSMSAKGNCYDNACAESFFHSLKVEAIHGERFVTCDQLTKAVFTDIEVDIDSVYTLPTAQNPVAFKQSFKHSLAS